MKILVLAIVDEKATGRALPWSSPHSWMKYLHVCGTWRDLLQQMSAVWDNIEATKAEVAEYKSAPGRARKSAVEAFFEDDDEVEPGGTDDKGLAVLKRDSSHIMGLKLDMPRELWQRFSRSSPIPWIFSHLNDLHVYTTEQMARSTTDSLPRSAFAGSAFRWLRGICHPPIGVI